MYIQVIQMLTLVLACMSAPACTNTPTTSLWPFSDPKCKAVQPPLYVYNNEMMTVIFLQSYSQYHLLVLYYYRLSSFLLYILLYCCLEIIYITTKIDTNLFELCSKTRRIYISMNYLCRFRRNNCHMWFYVYMYIHKNLYVYIDT